MARPSYDDGNPQMPMRLAWPPLPRAVKWLLLANSAVFLVSFLLPDSAYAWVERWLMVDPHTWRETAPLYPAWQLFSYGFLHDISGLGHILMNMLVLYMFGSMLESELGARRFLITYFAAQLLGGALFLGVALATGSDLRLLGASGGCFGVMVAAAALWPNAPVILYFIPLRLRTLALIFVGIEVFSLLVILKGSPSDGVAHITHLGGALYGFVAVRTGLVRWDPVRALAEHRVAKAVEGAAEDEQRMDQLLEKIHREGMASLTRGEREFLKRVSSRR